MNVRRMYRQIARRNGVTVKEVRDGMQEAISAAYQNPQRDSGMTAAYQGGFHAGVKSLHRRR